MLELNNLQNQFDMYREKIKESTSLLGKLTEVYHMMRLIEFELNKLKTDN